MGGPLNRAAAPARARAGRWAFRVAASSLRAVRPWQASKQSSEQAGKPEGKQPPTRALPCPVRPRQEARPGIYADPAGSLTLVNVDVINCRENYEQAPGLWARGTPVSVQGGEFRNNVAGGGTGGAVYFAQIPGYSGGLSIKGTKFSGNKADAGGAIYVVKTNTKARPAARPLPGHAPLGVPCPPSLPPRSLPPPSNLAVWRGNSSALKRGNCTPFPRAPRPPFPPPSAPPVHGNRPALTLPSQITAQPAAPPQPKAAKISCSGCVFDSNDAAYGSVVMTSRRDDKLSGDVYVPGGAITLTLANSAVTGARTRGARRQRVGSS